MGLFSMFGKKDDGNGVNNASNVQSTTSGNAPDMSGVTLSSLSLVKDVPNTQQGIVLKKSFINLDKSIISLEKKSNFSLGNHKARVFVAMDYSGSMNRHYKDGTVQTVLTTIMPLALQFDDNGELDVWLFDSGYRRIEGMTLNNFDNFVQKEILEKGWHMGCTSYAPVIEDMIKEHGNSSMPTYVLFITDGSNDDKRATDEAIRKAAEQNVFIQFVGVGNDSFDYLKKLDDLTGRPVDNTGFVKMSDVRNIANDTQLFEMLLDQYPDWLRAKGLN